MAASQFLNIMRRHLTPSQRSVIAAQMVTTEKGSNQHKEDASNEASITQDGAAGLLDVIAAQMGRRRRVLQLAT